MSPLNGPRRAPASGGSARQLVLFLHGVGANGADLIELADYYAEALPDAEFLAPDAPFPCDMAPFGRQWFSLQDRSPGPILAGIEKAAPILDGFIDECLTARKLDDSRLALVGFSQGSMMALHVSLRRLRPCAAVVAYSGMLAAPDLLPGQLTARPPVLLIHGEADDVVPCGFQPLAREALELMQVPVRTVSYPGLGHSINDDGAFAGLRFLAEHFGVVR